MSARGKRKRKDRPRTRSKAIRVNCALCTNQAIGNFIILESGSHKLMSLCLLHKEQMSHKIVSITSLGIMR